ncbi:Patatin/Phospholipase A2-related protein [Neofusicoccum parvum]|uniref:Patatin/Phospholipase A2-related protein n=1 Tax=Neofusicoccum parvum TaxID=310453 RepID=A0ACB5SAX8_9PEZI|nr:Patatin/Phospholipase A2-related protein [Neofusicoccum parvum]
MATLKVDTGTPQRPRSVRTFASADDDYSNGSEWARTVKDPWDPAILTLDGGGIRGYSSLLMVQQLMHEIAEWERKLEMEEAAEAATRRKDGTSTPPFEPRIFNEDELLPAHYFDFIYGTSTGGLIATMLGRLRMSVPQCLELYRQTAPAMATIGILGVWKKTRILICLTATHNERVNEAHLLRTYDHRYINVPNYITLYNEGADKLRIWEVTRATSAAPFYFKILEADIRGEIMGFKDGGIRENNPAGAAWSEFVSLYGEQRNPALLLSIGTGRPDESADGFASAWPGPFGTSAMMKKVAEKFAVFKNVLIKYTEGEEQHRAMVRIAKGENTWYKRLNVDHGLEKMKLDNWEKGPWAGPNAFAESAATATAMSTAAPPATVDPSVPELVVPSSTVAALRQQQQPPPQPSTGTDPRVVVGFDVEPTKPPPDASDASRGAAGSGDGKAAKKPRRPKPHPTVPGGRTLSRMEQATRDYLNRPFDHKYDTYAPPMTKVRQTAEKLVRQRRARERAAHEDQRRWDTYVGRWLTGEYSDDADGAVRWKLGGAERRSSLRELVAAARGSGSGRSTRGQSRERGEGEAQRRRSSGGTEAKASGETVVKGRGEARRGEVR